VTDRAEPRKDAPYISLSSSLFSDKIMKVTIYTPESSIRSPKKMVKDMFSDLLDSRNLAWQLTVRDIKAQYRQSALGMLWALILPLANTVTWIFLNMTGIVKLDSTGIPYPLYVFSGTLLWSIFMESLQAPLNLTTAAKGMLSKINFPREAIILSGIYQSAFNGLIKVALIMATFLIFGVYPGWNLLLFPFAFLSLILAGTAIGLFLTPVGMLYTDMGRAIPLAFQFLMYVTPIVFPIPKTGWVCVLFSYNPLTQLFMVCRDWLSGTATHFLNGFLLVNLFMLVLLFLTWLVYRLVMPIIIERMNA
jgi:lipopolysaccharide transport system permease protein